MYEWLAGAALEHPERAALRRANGAKLSYRVLLRRAAQVAARIELGGARRGDSVAWLGADAAHGIILMFALVRLGAVFVPLNTRLTASELHTQIALADARLLVCERATEAQAAQLAGPLPVRSFDAPHHADVQQLPNVPVEEAQHAAESDITLHAVQSIVFTSGTTGAPKGAQITCFNHYASAQASAQRLGTGQDDVWLLSLPLYHVGGMTIPFRALLSGARVVEFDGSKGFDPARMMRVLHDEQITMVSLVPTMLKRLLDAGFTGTPSLRAILLGGAAAPADLLERAWKRGLPVAPTYGLTEACSQVATMAPVEARTKPGSVGKPLQGTTVTIVREDGAAAAVGQIGEIVVRGPTVFRGYLNAPDDRTLRDGVLWTGDMGYADADGDLFVVQRRTDLIVTGGENVYPAEVEAVLRQHPTVAEACVVALSHPEWGQQVAAAVVLRPGAVPDEAALRTWCRERMAGYKCPRPLRVVDALPVTASGKVLRRDVAKLFDANAS
ncbi:MAG TPA: o-succinylbenzoate--CoA ligase [Candidatus Limnocylindrales bacterium]|nr:o-succinylbenzoate--CoA ligase [Candidatus Limnocylindrales bacterium]